MRGKGFGVEFVSLGRFLRRLIPPARRRVTMWSVLPLVMFLALFLSAWLVLELRGIVRFTSYKPLFLILVMPWLWWMYIASSSGLGPVRGLVALLVRLGIVGLLIMLLAGPRAVRESDILAVMYAVDLSDSLGEQAQYSALDFVARTISGKPEKDRAGLLVFGRNAAVELPPRLSFPLEGDKVMINSRILRDGTNLEKALSLALACLPEENQGRIVLISDGAQTEGALTAVLDHIKSRDVSVDVLPVNYDFEHEVWLERLELPRSVKSGETYEASVVLSSLRSGEGMLTLTENGERIFGERVEYGPGKNRFTLPLYMRGPGYYEYEARIDPPKGKDGWQENNVALNHLYLKGKGRVLVVTDPQGDERDWQVLVGTLREAGQAVDVRLAYEFPGDPLSLLPYDCVVFPNVAADSFDVVQLDALKSAVYNRGVGFLMVGGRNSYGPGGYSRTAVEEVLPVNMDISQKKVMPKGALAIVLHTCEFAQGNTWAKRITKEAMRVLSAKDEVGVLAYGYPGGDKWLFKLTPAGEYERLVPLINKAEIGDMPSFGGTMKMGLDGLNASDAAMKHMIVISDGDPSPPTPQLVAQFVQSQVSISTVAINPHGGQDVSIMQSIAAATGGRYYFPQDPARLPSIFIKEAKTLRRSMIQNKTFVPTIEFPSPVLKGVEAVPPLHGYVLTTPKPRSTTILEGPEEEPDPVLVTWRFGLGKTAAFTSDLSPNWGKDWVQWERYRGFVKQLMTDISRVETENLLRIQSLAAGSRGFINIEDYNPQGSFLEIETRVTGPRNRSITLHPKQVGPRRYQAEFDLWGKGRYQILALGAGDARQESAMGGFAVPYSAEYLRFRYDPIVLDQIVERTGGRFLEGNETGEDVFGKGRKPRESTRPVHDWFLVVLAFLVPFDVGIRRVQLDWHVIRSWFALGRARQPSGGTLGTLLKVKDRIGGGPKVIPQAGPTVAPHVPTVSEKKPEARPSKAPPEKGKPKELEERPAEGLSTTERLLRLKRKWKEDRTKDEEE